MEFEDKPTRGECPFCGELAACAHLVLRVDLHNQRSMGGTLGAEFDIRWERIVEAEGEERWGEHQTLVDLLNEFTGVVDYDREWDFESGPGQSVTYWDFYCEKPGKLTKASRFLSATQ